MKDGAVRREPRSKNISGEGKRHEHGPLRLQRSVPGFGPLGSGTGQGAGRPRRGPDTGSIADDRRFHSTPWLRTASGTPRCKTGKYHLLLRSHIQTFGPVRTTSHVHHDGKLFSSMTLRRLCNRSWAWDRGASFNRTVRAEADRADTSAFSALAGDPASAALHHGGCHSSSGNTAVSGQLCVRRPGSQPNNGISHIDTDGAGRVIEIPTAWMPTSSASHTFGEQYRARCGGWALFLLTADGYLRDGRITNTDHTDQSGQIQQIDQIFGTG